MPQPCWLFISLNCRCGNVAAILELDEHLKREFTIFEAAPQVRVLGVSSFYKQFELFNGIILWYLLKILSPVIPTIDLKIPITVFTHFSEFTFILLKLINFVVVIYMPLFCRRWEGCQPLPKSHSQIISSEDTFVFWPGLLHSLRLREKSWLSTSSFCDIC